jgi:hypothetical protein
MTKLRQIFENNRDYVVNSGYDIQFSHTLGWVSIYPPNFECTNCGKIRKYQSNDTCPYCGTKEISDPCIFLQGDDATQFLEELSKNWDNLEIDLPMHDIALAMAMPYIDSL